MPRWFRWRGRLWHLRVYRDRRDRWVGLFLPGVEMRGHVSIFVARGSDGQRYQWTSQGAIAVRTVYVCPLPMLVIKLWRYES